MTFEHEMIKAMKARGMFDNQAQSVMEEVIQLNKIPHMDEIWKKRVDSYPQQMVNIVWISVKEHAFNWIEKNCPEAWFKPMFQYSDFELSQKIAEKQS